MSATATLLGVVLVIVAIPFGLMLAPLTVGLLVAVLGWRHVSAPLQAPSPRPSPAARVAR